MTELEALRAELAAAKEEIAGLRYKADVMKGEIYKYLGPASIAGRSMETALAACERKAFNCVPEKVADVKEARDALFNKLGIQL